MKNNHRIETRILHGLLLLAAMAGVVAVVMLLWNYLIPSLTGWTFITYPQAIALFVLCKLLFGGFGRWGHLFHPGYREMHHSFHNKFAEMSPIERRDHIRQHFEGHPFNKKRPADHQESKEL